MAFADQYFRIYLNAFFILEANQATTKKRGGPQVIVLGKIGTKPNFSTLSCQFNF